MVKCSDYVMYVTNELISRRHWWGSFDRIKQEYSKINHKS